MTVIILKLLDIMRLRSGPQDLPAQMPLAWIVAALLFAAYVAEGFIADSLLGEPETAPRSLLGITLQFTIVAALIQWRGFGSRMAQTVSALAGTGLVFGVFSVIMLLQASPERDQPLLLMVWFATFIWSLTVDAHIYRHALSIKMSQGVLVAIVIFATNLLLSQWIFENR